VRIRLVDLGAAALPLGVGLLSRAGYHAGWSPAFLAVFSVPLYWGRRYPLGVLLVVFTAGLVQLTAAAVSGAGAVTLVGLYDLGIILAIYFAVSYGRRWTRVFAVAGGIAGAAAGAAVWLGPRMSTPNVTLGLGLLFAPVLLAWATGTTARTRRAYLAGLVERADRLERERQALALVAVAEERERIARELHDIVAHSVSLMVVASDGADAALEQRNTAEARKAVVAIGRTGRDALTELRLLLGMLRSDHEPAGPQPGAGQLRDLIESVPVPVRLSVDGRERELPQGLGLAVFRIVQEALTNTVKHAGPDARAGVRLSYGDRALEIEVTDDGTGAAPPGPPGHGLIGMRERAAMFGGTLTAGPGSCGGFRVRVLLPWA
jgi:signal transduction histidine kinase